MVAITVILAAVIGTMVMGLTGNVSQTAPQASFQFNQKNVSGNPVVMINDNGGDTINHSNIQVEVNGNTAYSNTTSKTKIWTSGDVSAGSTATVEGYDNSGSAATLKRGDTVKIIWVKNNGKSAQVLASYDIS